MSNPTPIELETLAALEQRAEPFLFAALDVELELGRVVVDDDLERRLFDRFAATLAELDVAPPPPTIPALTVELELLVDELLAVDLELEAWRADLTERIPS